LMVVIFAQPQHTDFPAAALNSLLQDLHLTLIGSIFNILTFTSFTYIM